MDRYAISLNDSSTIPSERTLNQIFELSISERLEPLPISMKPHTFPQLKSLAKSSLLNHLDKLIPFIEIDIYNKINYTCDYYLNSTNSQGLTYMNSPYNNWYTNFDSNEESFFPRIFKNYSKVSLPFDGLFKFTGDGVTGDFLVPDLCNRFSFYVYENLPTLIWYTPNNSRRVQNNKYLLTTLKKVENYNFTDSDFYLFECLTNINSVIVIADIIYRALSYKTLHDLLDEKRTEENEQYSTLINKLINMVASSSLIYSKSMILVELFSQAEEIFDIKNDFEFLISFVTIQFELVDKLFDETMPLHALSKKRFSKLLDIATKENPDCDISCLYSFVKEKNITTFNNNYPNASHWLAPHSLILSKPKEYVIQKTHQVNTAAGYANVYVQKKFQAVLSGHTIFKNSSNDHLENIPLDENGNILIIREQASGSTLSCSIICESNND